MHPDRRDLDPVQVLALTPGASVSDALLAWCAERGVEGAVVSGIGELDGIELDAFVPAEGRVRRVCPAGTWEVLSLLGELRRTADGGCELAARVVLGGADGSVTLGDLRAARCASRLELGIRPLRPCEPGRPGQA